MTVIADTRVTRLLRTASRTGHQHSGDQRIVETVNLELVTASDVVSLPPGSLITLQRGPGSGLTEEGSVLNFANNDIGGVASGQTSSVSFYSEDAGVTASSIFQTEIDFSLVLSSAGQYAVNYKTFQIKTYTSVPTTPGTRIQINYTWAPIREYIEWSPEGLIPELTAFGVGPHAHGGGQQIIEGCGILMEPVGDGYILSVDIPGLAGPGLKYEIGSGGCYLLSVDSAYGGDNIIPGCNILVGTTDDGYKEISLDIQSLAGVGLLVSNDGYGCNSLNVDIDGYQVGYSDTLNHLIFADNIQDAITEIDANMHIGDVVQVRKFGSDAEDYPYNTIYSTNGNTYVVGSKRLLMWVNGIPLFSPDDYIETSSTTILLSTAIDDSDIIDIWLLPKFLGLGSLDSADLQLAYNNSLTKEIIENLGQISFIQPAATGAALRLVSNTSLTPSLIIDQSGTGEAIRAKSVDATKPSLLVQKDTVSRNSIVSPVIIERTTTNAFGAQIGIGSSILTRFENSGSVLFTASNLVTGSEGVSDSAENTYFSIELSDDGILKEKLRINSNGNVGIGTNTPDTFILETSGDIGPSADNTYSVGSVDKRWKDGYFGPHSLHVVSKVGETPDDHTWTLEINSLGGLIIADNNNELLKCLGFLLLVTTMVTENCMLKRTACCTIKILLAQKQTYW
jgi:hypothetical protein